MNLLLLSTSYPPVLNSAARLFSELAEGLSRMDRRVTVLTSCPERYTAHHEALAESKSVGGLVDIVRLPVLKLSKRIPLLRAFEHFFFALQYYLHGRRLPRQDVVIVYSPPLPLAVAGILLARRWKGRAVINVQDLYPQSVIDLGFLRNRFLIKWMRRMERWVYRNADHVTVHSEGNRRVVSEIAEPGTAVYTIPNWIDMDRYHPNCENGFRQEHQLDDAFLVSYAGIMGFAQGVGDILDAAEILKQDRMDLLFVLAGSGVSLDELKASARERGLENVRFLPHLDEPEYIRLLQSSDVNLVTLNRRLRTPVVPGKLPCIMAVGGAVVCSTPGASDARTIVEEADCGLWADVDRPGALSEAILALYQDKARRRAMGQNGRVYAEVHFRRETCIAKYGEIIGQG